MSTACKVLEDGEGNGNVSLRDPQPETKHVVPISISWVGKQAGSMTSGTKTKGSSNSRTTISGSL